MYIAQSATRMDENEPFSGNEGWVKKEQVFMGIDYGVQQPPVLSSLPLSSQPSL